MLRNHRHRLAWHLYSPTHRLCRSRIREKRFTIISNNCWGGGVYQDMGLPYMTPFVGLFVLPPCYVRLLSDLRGHLRTPLRFVSETTYPEIQAQRELRGLNYPIGMLGDVEIHFMHYVSEQVAIEKWNRRVQRVQWDRLFFKFCEYQRPRDEQLDAFDRMPFAHKVCFSRDADRRFGHRILVPDGYRNGAFPNGAVLYRVSKAFFDIADWLNGGTGRPGALQTYICSGWLEEHWSRDGLTEGIDRLSPRQ